MKIRAIAASFVVSALALGCASQGVVVRHQPAADTTLSAFPRYHLVVATADEGTQTNWMIEKAIHDDLRQKGYVPVDIASADVIVTYRADIDDASAFDAAHSLDGSLATRRSAEKHIAIDFVDAHRQQPVWRGTAIGEVHPGHMTASVREALDDLLAGVPNRQ